MEEKKTFKQRIIDKAGWGKKNIRKIITAIATLVIIAIAVKGALVWSDTHALGFRVNMGISRVQYTSYSHIGPDFSFKFPNAFVADSDEQQKYGDSYLGGFRLQSDQRTGCDVRSNPVGINFQKSDKEIHDAVVSDLSAHIKDFQEISTLRRNIGGENAYEVNFAFTDPLGSRTRISQIITSHQGDSYIFVCGTGDYQYNFFADDFNDFYKSFRWAQ